MGAARDWMNQHSREMTIVAVLVLLVSLMMIVLRSKTPTPVAAGPVYYYDLGSSAPDSLDRLFPASPQEFPPISAPSGYTNENGPGGVRAFVFACGDCSDRSSLFIGYLETNTPQGKAAAEEQARAFKQDPGAAQKYSTPTSANPNHLVGSPDGRTWFIFESRQGANLIDAVRSRCSDESHPLTDCDPPKEK